jgi:hypothetical protein
MQRWRVSILEGSLSGGENSLRRRNPHARAHTVNCLLAALAEELTKLSRRTHRCAVVARWHHDAGKQRPARREARLPQGR